MKWITILLLLTNVSYCGLKINSSLEKSTPATRVSHKDVKNSAKSLVLLSELKELPALRKELRVIETELESDSDPFDLEQLEMIQQNTTQAESIKSESTEVVKNEELPFDSVGTCLSIGPYQSDIDVMELNKWLQSNNIPYRKRTEEKRTSERYWVYLAPQTEAKAKAQFQELKRKGLKNYYLIGKGNMKNAISLGLFSRQRAVNKRVVELKRVGYNPVVVPQHKITKLLWLDIQVNSDQTLPKLSNTTKTVNIDCKTIALLGSDQ